MKDFDCCKAGPINGRGAIRIGLFVFGKPNTSTTVRATFAAPVHLRLNRSKGFAPECGTISAFFCKLRDVLFRLDPGVISFLPPVRIRSPCGSTTKFEDVRNGLPENVGPFLFQKLRSDVGGEIVQIRFGDDLRFLRFTIRRATPRVYAATRFNDFQAPPRAARISASLRSSVFTLNLIMGQHLHGQGNHGNEHAVRPEPVRIIERIRCDADHDRL